MLKNKETPPANAGGNGKHINKADVLAEQLMQAGAIRYFSQQPEPRQWLINHFLPKGQVVLLAGLGAEGKTMLCLQWIIQLAAGIDFHKNAQTNASKDFKAIVVSAEDDKTEIHTRIRRIAEYYIVKKNLSEDILQDIESSITAITDDTAPEWFNALTVVDRNGVQPTASFSVLKHLVLSKSYNLVIIDALTSAFTGNLNDMMHSQQILRLCKELTKNGATVIVVHHMNKSAMSNVNSFDDLLSRCFGSVGTLNKIRHNLILFKEVLFVGKTNIAKRVALRVPKNEDYSIFDPWAQHLLDERNFDDIVKSLNPNSNAAKKEKIKNNGNGKGVI